MIDGWSPLVPEIFGQTDRVEANSIYFRSYIDSAV